MYIPSFTGFVRLLICSVSFIALNACDSIDTKKMVDAVAGVTGAAVCYKTVGGGNMRYVSGAACGAGAAMLADWLQSGGNKQETARVQSEYQRGLSITPDYITSKPFIIQSKNGGENVMITLNIWPRKFTPPSTECRDFGEIIAVEGHINSQKDRRACHEILSNNTWSDWAIVSG